MAPLSKGAGRFNLPTSQLLGPEGKPLLKLIRTVERFPAARNRKPVCFRLTDLRETGHLGGTKRQLISAAERLGRSGCLRAGRSDGRHCPQTEDGAEGGATGKSGSGLETYCVPLSLLRPTHDTPLNFHRGGFDRFALRHDFQGVTSGADRYLGADRT